MSFTIFSPTKFTRNFITPVAAHKPAGAGPAVTRNASARTGNRPVSNTRPVNNARSVNRKATTENLKHAPETVGHIMTSDYVTVEATMTAGAALEKVRVLAHVVERVYTIYVTGPGNRLDGTVSLRDLLIADPMLPISHFMSHPRVCITTDTFTERAAKIMDTQFIDEIPVIDNAASLVGVVTLKATRKS